MTVLPSETPISQAIQEASASNSGGNNVLTTILVIVTILLATGGGVMKWLYPNTIEEVEAQIKVVEELIESNMALDCNILGDSAWVYRERLIRENGVAARIRNRMNAEPDRKKILAWVVFRWRQMQDVKANYLSVMELKENLTTIENETYRRCNAPANAGDESQRTPVVEPGEEERGNKETPVRGKSGAVSSLARPTPPIPEMLH
ncbi:hypothetical protein L218DRAFT_1002974 [Marasmius fiardii PR-910]|nr:hypothetical protein L218DRAFT_1002974 [Marasmius fiardii PR-910]